MALVLNPGDQYGRFTIVERIGEGGFGQVFRVKDPRYAVDVALKVSHQPVTDPATAQRALREVTILRDYDNAYTVAVLDYGLNRDGHIYVLMELLDGVPLDRFHDFDRRLDPRWVCHILYETCLGLQPAHDHGVVHRDLKPANIFIGRDHHIKVLDFGLARSWDETQAIVGRGATVGEVLVGTPHYAQPEQLVTRQLTPAADVYSLSLLAYEMLTGFTPFVPGKTVSQVIDEWYSAPLEWLKAHANAPVIPMNRFFLTARVPEGLQKLIEQGLHKDPAERPPNARVLAEAVVRHWPASPAT